MTEFYYKQMLLIFHWQTFPESLHVRPGPAKVNF